jgi:acetolactate synthase-1/2/3 large subunit
MKLLGKNSDERSIRSWVLWGDALLGLQDLQAAEIPLRMVKWRQDVSARLISDEVPVSKARLMTEINRVLPADGYLVADGGFAAHWGGLRFDTKRAGRHLVPGRGFAPIGYRMPGAMGVAMAAPGKTVLSLTGDGGFNMMLGEIETARRLGLTFTVIVVNNPTSGYVKVLQHLVYGAGSYHASDLAETDYAAAAKVLGCDGIRVEEPGQLAAAWKQVMSLKGPTVVDVVVTRDPVKTLPGVDNRTATIRKGDRLARRLAAFASS